MTLEFRLIGPFEARWNGEDRPVTSRRGRAIVGLLAMSPGRSMARDRLAAMLWPDRDEAQARASLRQELSALRRALGPDCAGALEASGDRVRLCDLIELRADVWSLLNGGLASDPGGELLEDADVRSAPYEDWLAEQRRMIQSRRIDLAETALKAAEGVGDWVAVAAAADRLLSLDPYSETAVAAQMRAAAARGRAPEALTVFADHAQRLDAELGAQPGVALKALRDDIAAGGGGGTAPAPAAAPGAFFNRPAVLLFSFECLSGGDEDRMIAHGLADDLRTTLSYWRWFPVIGPDAIGWKSAREVDLRRTATEVEAAYAVTGSLRRAGDRVRITVGLTEVETGRSLWSGNFDGSLEDVFAFQEEASRAVVAQLEPQIASAEAARIERAPPTNLSPWQLLAQADEIDRRGGEGYGTPEANFEQVRLAERALEIDPGFAPAHARLGRVYFRAALLGWLEDRDGTYAKSIASTERALELDPDNWEAHAYNGLARIFGTLEYPAGRYHGAEAVRLNPSAALAHHAAGCALEWIGDTEAALGHLHLILRLNPAYNGRAAALGDITTCEMFTGNREKALEAARQLLAIAPNYARGLQRCVATFGFAGEKELARDALAKLLKIQPDFDEDYVRATYPYARAEDLEMFLEGLRKAGAFGA